MEACKIWEVARATSAATTLFHSMTIGRDNVEYIDAGFGYNNPCKILLEEAKKAFPRCKAADFVVVSIGTGLKSNVQIRDRRTSILLALKDMASSSERVANEMESEFGDGGRYHRFNVASGLESIGLAEWKKNDEISTHTHNYMDRPEQLRRVGTCAKVLSLDKVRKGRSRWRVDRARLACFSGS
jgi:hypothetical protein